jgi:hypothetical protein
MGTLAARFFTRVQAAGFHVTLVRDALAQAKRIARREG